MRWQPLAIVLALFVAAAPGARADEADEAYAQRTDRAKARHARDLWIEAARKDPNDYDVLWKLARADYWLGGHVPEKERMDFFEDGVTRARAAVALQPMKPEGHFWLAANMGGAAEASSRAGIRYRKPIKEELETVLRLDPGYMRGSADRALGRWYARVPRLFGGNKKNAEAHLRKSLTYDPTSTSSHFFLAELLLDTGRKEEARAEAMRVLDAPVDPEWEPENQDFKAQARTLLAKLK